MKISRMLSNLDFVAANVVIGYRTDIFGSRFQSERIFPGDIPGFRLYYRGWLDFMLVDSRRSIIRFLVDLVTPCLTDTFRFHCRALRESNPKGQRLYISMSSRNHNEIETDLSIATRPTGISISF